MKRNKSIQVKAAILLVVFSLNTVIGFACSIGLDKVFAFSEHHAKETKAVVHTHADGKKHVHYEKQEIKAVVHVHADGKKHVHKEKPAKQKENISPDQNNPAAENNTPENKNKCCTTKVTQFEQLDKYVPQSVKIDPNFFTTLTSDFFNIKNLYTSHINTNIKYFVRSYHPPIPSIRIAIQSFQI
jgi:hypothetical protein